MNIVALLRYRGYLYRAVGSEHLAHIRHRAQRRRAVKLWAGRLAYTVGYLLVAGVSVALIWSL